MKSIFEFRSVGQGLFYTGLLNDGEYTFVYDCGTESSQKYLEREIAEFAPYKLRKKIDFIVISHLHKDHFSGLISLMNNANIHKVFLPYLGRNNVNLIRLIIAHAVFSNETENLEYNENNHGLYNRIIDLYENRRQGNYNVDVEFLGEETFGDESSRFAYSKQEIDASQKDFFWKFIFINKRINDNDLKRLENEVSVALSVLGVNAIEDCLKTIEGIKKIQFAYEKIFGKGNDLNLTSTIMAHYPNRIPNGLFIWENCNYRFDDKLHENHFDEGSQHCFHWRFNKKMENIVTLLTGDAEFDYKIQNILEKELNGKCAAILQVPHHGSKVNWESLGNFQLKFDCYVIPFGLGNKYQHPNSTVIDDIVQQERNKMIYCATQARAVRYTIIND